MVLYPASIRWPHIDLPMIPEPGVRRECKAARSEWKLMMIVMMMVVMMRMMMMMMMKQGTGASIMVMMGLYRNTYLSIQSLCLPAMLMTSTFTLT